MAGIEDPDFVDRGAEGDSIHSTLEDGLGACRSDRLPGGNYTGVGNGAYRFVFGLSRDD
jgi:hypothetical protein